MGEKPYTNEDWLRNQLADKTKVEVAQECDVSEQTIYYWIDKFGIQTTGKFHPDNTPYKNKDWLSEKWEEAESVQEIADDANADPSTITKWAREFGLPHFNRNKEYWDKDLLRELYHGEKLTQAEIGEKFGVSKSAISQAMKHFGISVRGKSERYLATDIHPQYYTHPRGHVIVASEYKGEESKTMMHTLVAIADGADPYELFAREKVVHHENGVKWDNRPENLTTMTDSEHMKHHWENGDIPTRGEWLEDKNRGA